VLPLVSAYTLKLAPGGRLFTLIWQAPVVASKDTVPLALAYACVVELSYTLCGKNSNAGIRYSPAPESDRQDPALAGQEHAPDAQVWPDPHALPQAPQLAGSV